MTSRRTCPVVGLVGGVGSGKSTLARLLSERYGAAVIDGDVEGHRALTHPNIQERLREAFGDDIFTIDGTIDRKALARHVFGDSPEHRAAKRDLERITHPFIHRELNSRISEACEADAPLILLDAAVLLEAGWREFCDAVIFVEAADHLRRSRAMSRGWSEADWRRREAAQLSLQEKRRTADAIIENSGAVDEAVQALVTKIERICGVLLPRHAAAVGP